MLPVFATNLIDLYVLEISSAIFLLQEVISALTRTRAPDAKRHDRGSGFVVIFSVFMGISIGINTAFSAVEFAISQERMLIFGIGIFLILAGVAFRGYSIWVLGKFFTTTVSIQPGQTVIEKGPYRYIRHPSYSGAFLSFLGFGLTLTNWLSLGVVILGTAIGYGYRVYIEEQTLVAGLGQPYRDYIKRTKRFIPFVF